MVSKPTATNFPLEGVVEEDVVVSSSVVLLSSVVVLSLVVDELSLLLHDMIVRLKRNM